MGEFWTRKYAPKASSGLMGQDEGLSALRKFIVDFKPPKGCLIYGPPGCGKTAAVYALANELGLELVELNASDFRNSDAIESIVGGASKQMSLFFKSKLILVDEIDGLAGREDRGGLLTILKLLKESSFPLVLTANDPWDTKFSGLRKACHMVQFNKLDHSAVLHVLKQICQAEKISFEDDALEGLARRADGDLRGAMIDLFILTRVNSSLGKQELEMLYDRKREISVIDGITRILKTKDIEIALGALEDVSEDLDEVLMWMDENMPREYTKAVDLARGYEALSKAAVFKGRISRQQHWRFLVYISALLTVGVALAKDEKYKQFVKYERSGRPLKIWIYNRKNLLRKSIAQKLARLTHSSVHYAFAETVPYIQVIYKNDKDARAELDDALELDEKEIEWLKEI
jgi:replication factor C large subunit